MPTLADGAVERTMPGAAREGMAPGAEVVGASARMGPLPSGIVVRGCDEDLGEIAVLGGILREVFVCARCALRVAGAHQTGRNA